MIWWSRGLVDLALTGYLWATVQALTELTGRRVAWLVPTPGLLVGAWGAHPPLHRARPRGPRRDLRRRPHVRPPGAGAQARPPPRHLPAPAAAGRPRPLLLPRPRRGLPVPDAPPPPRDDRGRARLRAGLA